MAEPGSTLGTPWIRHGLPLATAAAIAAVAVLVVDDQGLRNTLLLVAAVEVLVVPRLLARIAEP